jgi:hypothetical protein
LSISETALLIWKISELVLRLLTQQPPTGQEKYFTPRKLTPLSARLLLDLSPQNMRKGSMRRRTLTKKPEPLGDILQKVLKKMDVPHKRTDRRIVALWKSAVGPQIASRTLPESFRRGSLYVLVSTTAWLHQLQFLKEEILSKLNELSGQDEFQRLFFSIGEFPEQQPDTVNDRNPPDLVTQELGKRDRQMMEKSLTAIRDPELREAIEKAMVREISRRRELQKRKGI